MSEGREDVENTGFEAQIAISLSIGGAGGRTRTGTVSLPVDFESTTSANSITPASVWGIAVVIISQRKEKIKFFLCGSEKPPWPGIFQLGRF